MWNRQRTDFDLIDPVNTSLGHRQVQRWNLPEGWVISKHPAHPALVSEADFIAAQDTTVPRGPAGPAARRYLLAGLIACGRCGRRLESAWSNGKPAYRCRHGYTSATSPDPARPKNTYIREEQILPHQVAVGRAGYHGPPDPSGMVEIGYAVDPAYRRRGCARAALEALLQRAAREPQVRTVRVTISPGNAASYQLASQYGFTQTGEQWDDEDGLEIIYEVGA